MRVLIDTTYAVRAPRSGTGVYITQVVRALRARPGEIDLVTAANPRRRPPAGGGLGSARNALADVLWTERELPRIAREGRADLIHHPLPARSHATGIPQVVTVHDLAFERMPQAFDPRFRRYAHLAHRDAARHAAAVIVPSETTAADALELWGVDRDRLTVAPHGPGQALVNRTHPPEAAASRPSHFLYVGDQEPRKDLATLRQAHARAATALPLVQARGAGTGELGRLYAQAAALVQPSRYEGFGLTALEAMALGTPVIAARSPGLTETCGEAARYFTPGDAAELAALLTEIERDPAERVRLSAAARARAAGFSWRAAAERHLAAYSLALT